jgi:hypothetical protein
MQPTRRHELVTKRECMHRQMHAKAHAANRNGHSCFLVLCEEARPCECMSCVSSGAACAPLVFLCGRDFILARLSRAGGAYYRLLHSFFLALRTSPSSSAGRTTSSPARFGLGVEEAAAVATTTTRDLAFVAGVQLLGVGLDMLAAISRSWQAASLLPAAGCAASSPARTSLGLGKLLRRPQPPCATSPSSSAHDGPAAASPCWLPHSCRTSLLACAAVLLPGARHS